MPRLTGFATRGAAAIAGLLAFSLAHSASAQSPCPGDCDGDGQVSIAELIRAVAISIGDASVSVCLRVDTDGNGIVGINELIQAVNSSALGCGGTPATPRPTSTPQLPFPTSTRTPTSPPVAQCPQGEGPGLNGRSFPPQNYRYVLSTDRGSTAVDGQITWGARFNAPNLTEDSFTGSLRASLWALSFSFGGQSQVQGFRVVTVSPNFSGQGARSANQLFNFFTASNIVSSNTGTTPPPGSYCMVLFLEEFDSTNCSLDDGYCYVDWFQFDGAEQFR